MDGSSSSLPLLDDDEEDDDDDDCRFLNPVSYCYVLTWGNASCLTQCHLGFVSDLFHFLSRPVAAR